MTTSAIYLRISADKGKATGAGGLAVERQDTEIRKMLDRKGWTAGKVYTDNDLTASGAKRRPAYEQMVSDFEAGEIQAIAAWDLDRLWRVPTEFEALLNLVDKQGLMLATVGGDADLSTDNGILYARIKVAVAADELRKRAARQRAKFAQDRETGKHHWRGRRPFGLELDGSLNEREAEALKTVANRVLDGATLNSCVDWLNKEGIYTTFNKPWHRYALKRTLQHPRIIGMMERDPLSKEKIKEIEKAAREGKGAPLPPIRDRELIPGNWKPILEEDTWRTLGKFLDDRPATQTKNTEKEYLLSGVAVCGKILDGGKMCGASVYGTRVLRRDETRATTYVYRCSKTPSHVSKTMDKTNAQVTYTLNGMLSMAHIRDSFNTEDKDNRLKALRLERTAEVNDWADWQREAVAEDFRPSQYRAPREKHERRLREIDAEVAQLSETQLFTYSTNGSVKFHFADLPLEQRRRLLRMVFAEIIIRPSAKGVRFNPESIELELSQTVWDLMEKNKDAREAFNKERREYLKTLHPAGREHRRKRRTRHTPRSGGRYVAVTKTV